MSFMTEDEIAFRAAINVLGQKARPRKTAR
jgi:hypothetical protein